MRGGGLIGAIGGAGIIIIGGCGVRICGCAATESAIVGGAVPTCDTGGFTGTGFGFACGFADITADAAIFFVTVEATFFGPIFSFSSSGNNPFTCKIIINPMLNMDDPDSISCYEWPTSIQYKHCTV